MDRDRPYLWQEMSALAGVGRWRMGRIEAADLPERVDGSRESFFILGQEWHFQHRERVDVVLRLIEDELVLNPETWRGQARFFRELFRSFYRDRDDPAWICLVGCRKSFPQRIQQVGGRVEHVPQRGKVQCRLADIGAETLWLNDTAVSTAGLRMYHRSGVQDPELLLQQVFVTRVLRDDGLGLPLSTEEEWMFLVTPDSQEMRSAYRGFNLNIEEFRDPVTLVQSAPIVTLFRLAERGTTTIARAFTLRPGVGDVIDIRPLDYQTEYLFRSNLQNPTMLRRMTTPGGFELLDHG